MPRSTQEIVSLYRSRKNDLGPLRARASDISQVYDGIVTVPLPELDEAKAPAIANWLTQGLDQMAMRVASVTPNVMCPALRPGFKGSEESAKTRRRAHMAWWQLNHFDLQLSKRARWFIGYAAAPAVVRPDDKRGIPVWELRDPLSSYPAANPDPTGMCPEDCIFAVQRRLGWIASFYPKAARALDTNSSPNPDRLYECLEYIDGEEHVLIALGTSEPSRSKSFSQAGGRPSAGVPFVELCRFPNRVERCTVVIPQRLSLNDPHGQFDQMPGLYRMQARAMALWLIATERAIFPDTWFVSRPNETVTVMQTPDGRAGVVGQVKGGDLKEMAAVSAPQVAQIIQLLERNQMTTASVPSDFGGEPNSAVRTGRAQENSMSATVDFWVQEAQKAFGYAFTEENKLAIKISREYFGDRQQYFYVNFGKVQGAANYTPNKDFDTDANIVAWPHAGTDVNSLVIGIGQRLGLGEMSKRTARILDPYIDDPDLEEDRVTAESLSQAMNMAISQAIASGQIGPLEVGRMYQLVLEEKESIYDAYNKVHQEVQQQAMAAQAAMQGPAGGAAGPGGPPGMGPGAGGAPGAGGGPPGLMAPGVAAQLGLPAGGNVPGGGVTAPTPSVDHMAQLMSALRPRNVGR
jgi:hypothetical protein